MSNIRFTNFARSTLAVGVTSGDTILALAGGGGAAFPALVAGQYFYATLEDAQLNREIVRVTGRTVDSLLVVRGQDNTAARPWTAGASVSLRLNAAAMQDHLTQTTASQTAAANSATTASNAATSATASQTDAANSATTASDAATSATASQTAAADSATAAAGSATAASASQTASANSATAAANSATAAAGSATSAATSATEAANSAASVNPANLVQVTGDQTIGGVKTFTSQIVASGGVQGNVTGNAGTVTNGVYTTGDQTIGGTKTFSSTPIAPGITLTDVPGAEIGVYAGNGDAASSTHANLRIKSWFGIGFSPDASGMPVPRNENAVWINTRTGDLSARGTVTAWGNITSTGGQFIGNGAGLTNLAAAQLTGDVAAARITSALNASGSAPIYACRAWVNFNGTGTVAIRASGNVSSITDNGVGDYTVNFTTAMPDANYAVAGVAQRNATNDGGGALALKQGVTPLNVSSVRVATFYGGSGNEDCPQVHVAIFR